MPKIKKRLPIELIFGLILLMILIFIAIFGPSLAPFEPDYLTPEVLSPMSWQHPMGTDGLGRDVFSLVLYGTRTSLKVGVLAALISLVLGTMIGALSGYYGGKLDFFVSEVINIFLMLPTLFLIIMVAAIFGSGINKVIFIIGLTSWMGTAKIMRSQAKSLRERTFIKAAKVIGESDWQIIFRHIIPNGIFPVLSNISVAISSAILYEASLSFIGLGDPNVVSWGQIIFNGRSYLTHGWWIASFAGLGIVLTVLSFHLISEGLNRQMNPKGEGAHS